MLISAIQFLCDALLQPFAAVLMLRFHLQWLRAPMRNAVGEFVMALTDFLVLRARRHIPPAWGLDSSSLLLAGTVEMIYLLATMGLHGYAFSGFPLLGLLAWTAVKLIEISLYLLIAALFIEAVLSWVNPATPVAPMLSAVTQPFLAPLRRRMRPVGRFDLSLFVLLIICQLTLIVPVVWLEQLAVSLL